MYVVYDEHPDDCTRWSRRRECSVCGARQTTSEKAVGPCQVPLFSTDNTNGTEIDIADPRSIHG